MREGPLLSGCSPQPASTSISGAASSASPVKLGRVAVVDVLLAAGAEDSTDGVLCDTALDAATAAGHRNVRPTLLRYRLDKKELEAPDPVDVIEFPNELPELLAGP